MNATVENSNDRKFFYMRLNILIILFLVPAAVTSQELLWEETVGGSKIDWLQHSFQNSKGNYIFSGYSYSNISEDKTSDSKGDGDMWIFETTPSGDIVWQQIFGGSFHDMIFKTLELPDGSYVLAGNSYSSISGDKTENLRGFRDLWILKLDANKNIEWQKTYGGYEREDLDDIIPTADGGFLVSSTTYSQATGDKTMDSFGESDLWILKLDSSGEIEWQKAYGGSGHDSYSRIAETPEGNYFVAASSSSGISGNKSDISRGLGDYWIFEISTTGAIIWQKTIGGENGDTFEDFEVTPDGGYLLAGSSASRVSGEKTEPTRGFDDVWLVKTDRHGKIQWQRTYGGNNTDMAVDISRSPESGYWIGARSASDAGSEKSEPHVGEGDHWMFKISEDGSKCWDKTLGGTNRETPRTGFVDAEDNYIMGGWSISGASGDKSEASKGDQDIWITKVRAPEIIPPVVNTPDPYIACDRNADGFAEFDLSNLQQDIIGEQEDLLLEYFTEDWRKLPSPMPDDFTNTTAHGQTINVRISRKDLPCAMTEIQIILVSNDCGEEEPDPDGGGEEEEKLTYFPGYFSPNHDGHNDTWGAFSEFKSQLKFVQVFDRYGQLVANLSPLEKWNGEFNGRPLPNDDYWYYAVDLSNKKITGHFSLIR